MQLTTLAVLGYSFALALFLFGGWSVEAQVRRVGAPPIAVHNLGVHLIIGSGVAAVAVTFMLVGAALVR